MDFYDDYFPNLFLVLKKFNTCLPKYRKHMYSDHYNGIAYYVKEVNQNDFQKLEIKNVYYPFMPYFKGRKSFL